MNAGLDVDRLFVHFSIDRARIVHKRQRDFDDHVYVTGSGLDFDDSANTATSYIDDAVYFYKSLHPIPDDHGIDFVSWMFPSRCCNTSHHGSVTASSCPICWL